MSKREIKITKFKESIPRKGTMKQGTEKMNIEMAQ